MQWYRREIKEKEIEVKFNVEISDVNTLDADAVIVATGSTPKTLPIKGFHKAIDATEYLSGTEVGEKVVVIGGGLTGCEVAYDLVLKGKKPIVVEMQNDLIAVRGVCLANSSFLREMLAYKNVPVYLNSVASEIRDDGVTIKDKDGNITELEADSVISAVGYNPNPLARNALNVYLVGDCRKVGNLRTVIWRAWDVAMKI